MVFRQAILWRRWGAFCRASAGAVFVEFSLALWPLLATLLFVYDTGTNFLTLRQVDQAGAALIEKMRSGQIDPRNYTQASFRQSLLCPAVTIVACDQFVVHLSDAQTGPKLTPTQVSEAQWCPGGPSDARILQIAFPVPFLSRIWAGALVDANVHYVSAFGLRNRPDVAAGAC